MTPKNPSFKNTLTKISDKHFYKKSGFVRISIFCFCRVGTKRDVVVVIFTRRVILGCNPVSERSGEAGKRDAPIPTAPVRSEGATHPIG